MNSLWTMLTQSATSMIRMDHRHVMNRFRKLAPDTSASECATIAHDICDALEVHAQLEEEIFYPAVRACGLELDVMDRSEHEHDEMRSLIAQVRALPPGDPQLPGRVRALMRAVLHHVADEETVVLPAADEHLADRLHELGARMTKRRLELLGLRSPRQAVDDESTEFDPADEGSVAPAPAAPRATTSALPAALLTVGAVCAVAWMTGPRRRGAAG